MQHECNLMNWADKDLTVKHPLKIQLEILYQMKAGKHIKCKYKKAHQEPLIVAKGGFEFRPPAGGYAPVPYIPLINFQMKSLPFADFNSFSRRIAVALVVYSSEYNTIHGRNLTVHPLFSN